MKVSAAAIVTQQHSDMQAHLQRHPGSCAENQELHKMMTDPVKLNASAANARLTRMEVRPNGAVQFFISV